MEKPLKEIIIVCGARPNFMKIAPLWREISKFPEALTPFIVHTGQHYDANMSGFFFEDLELPKPDLYLGIGSGSQTEQTAKIMLLFEKVLKERKPFMVLVVGDVTSTVASSLVSSKMMIPVAHVEAGLRSFDRSMPEEINRTVTDHLSDILFTTCNDGNVNLRHEGISDEKVFFAGNVMIDTLVMLKDKIDRSKIVEKLGIDRKNYAVATLHRPGNVDNPDNLNEIFQSFRAISERIPIVFPAHPRTLKNLKSFGISYDQDRIMITKPLGYLDFINLYLNSKFVMTDSGGIQEETTYKGIPCLTLRDNTERPITIVEGTNVLVGTKSDNIVKEAFKILDGSVKKGKVPELWDGKAAERIVKFIRNYIT